MEPFTQQQLDVLLHKPESRQLLSLLQKAGDAALQKAYEAAAVGDFSTVRQVLKPTLCRPETKAIIEKLRETLE